MLYKLISSAILLLALAQGVSSSPSLVYIDHDKSLIMHLAKAAPVCQPVPVLLIAVDLVAWHRAPRCVVKRVQQSWGSVNAFDLWSTENLIPRTFSVLLRFSGSFIERRICATPAQQNNCGVQKVLFGFGQHNIRTRTLRLIYRTVPSFADSFSPDRAFTSLRTKSTLALHVRRGLGRALQNPGPCSPTTPPCPQSTSRRAAPTPQTGIGLHLLAPRPALPDYPAMPVNTSRRACAAGLHRADHPARTSRNTPVPANTLCSLAMPTLRRTYCRRVLAVALGVHRDQLRPARTSRRAVYVATNGQARRALAADGHILELDAQGLSSGKHRPASPYSLIVQPATRYDSAASQRPPRRARPTCGSSPVRVLYLLTFHRHRKIHSFTTGFLPKRMALRTELFDEKSTTRLAIHDRHGLAPRHFVLFPDERNRTHTSAGFLFVGDNAPSGDYTLEPVNISLLVLSHSPLLLDAPFTAALWMQVCKRETSKCHSVGFMAFDGRGTDVGHGVGHGVARTIHQESGRWCVEQHRVIVDGQEIPGAKVSQQLRRVHELNAAANASPEYKKPQKSKAHPIGVEEFSDEEDKSASGFTFNDLVIVQLCSFLLTWLNLKAGVSQETANTILKALNLILNTALAVFQASLAAQGIQVVLPKIRIPKDLRTIYRNYTEEPELERTPCCPKCFTLYQSLATMPEIFDANDEDLWTDSEISDSGGQEDAEDVRRDEENFDPEQWAEWREQYLRNTGSEEDNDDDSTPRATPAPGSDDPMDGSTSAATPVPESNPPDEDDHDHDGDNNDDEFTDIANEFMGERVNHTLQKVPTNDHLWDMDYTRLKQFTRMGHLSAKKHDKQLLDGPLHSLDNILDPVDPKTVQAPTELDEAQLAKFLAKKSREIHLSIYTLVLDYLAAVGEDKLSFYGTRNAAGMITLPSPDHRSMILPPRGRRRHKFHVDKRTYSVHTSHAATSLIQFYEPGINPKQTSTGVITAIYQIPLDNILRTFVVVRRHQPLADPFYAGHPGLQTEVVDPELEAVGIVIEARQVTVHLSAWERPGPNRPVHGVWELTSSITFPASHFSVQTTVIVNLQLWCLQPPSLFLQCFQIPLSAKCAIILSLCQSGIKNLPDPLSLVLKCVDGFKTDGLWTLTDLHTCGDVTDKCMDRTYYGIIDVFMAHHVGDGVGTIMPWRVVRVYTCHVLIRMTVHACAAQQHQCDPALPPRAPRAGRIQHPMGALLLSVLCTGVLARAAPCDPVHQPAWAEAVPYGREWRTHRGVDNHCVAAGVRRPLAEDARVPRRHVQCGARTPPMQ
ncbi:hypothetical protein C8J57DRAFT_1478017 [Mycena rebaudengoi]|nr:hypothetical protein C8J57DRAFT_1478017 [Mycena rebaudengoi]